MLSMYGAEPRSKSAVRSYQATLQYLVSLLGLLAIKAAAAVAPASWTSRSHDTCELSARLPTVVRGMHRQFGTHIQL